MHGIPTHHPDLEKLAAFGLGRLSEADAQTIELHVADCEECLQKLAEVPDDLLVRLLQAPAADTQAFLSGSLADTVPSSRAGESAPTGFTVPRELDGHARYLVLGPLGAGGMGTVYKARHRLMERVVALKIVNPLLVNKPGAVERFTREVRAAAQLVHPNIVTAYDAEKVGDLHLLVMECVEGQTLAQILIVEHELPIATACVYLRQTALGLQHALKRGMVHRDIKPQNLMLVAIPDASVPPVIKILDFGLARFVSEVTQPEVIKILDFGRACFTSEVNQPDGSTEAGMIMGSPDYMAPEQGLDAHAADTRADIYGMGCTLYHLLAGLVPFPEASLLAKLEGHRDRHPFPLHLARPGVPVALAKVVEKMMAKDPALRYQTPAEVAEALRPFACGESPRTSGEKTPGVPAHPSAAVRNWLVAIAAGLLLACLGIWAAPLVFRVETPEGTLFVKTDDADVQISVKSGGKEVELFFPRQKKEISLKVGKYTVELVGGKDGLKLSTNQFEIRSGNDQAVVTVEFVPTVVKGLMQEKAKDPDRQAAAYVLSIGGKVRVNEQDRDITAAADLPGESFQLTTVIFSTNKQVHDVGLANFKGCKYVTHLELGNGNVKDCKYLANIGLGGTNANVSDAGLAHFNECKNLTYLALDGTRVSDAGLAHFKDCKDLFYLFLENTPVTDAGLAHFKGRNLGVIVLSGTQVTDAGLAHFKDDKNLYWLWLNNTKVGDAGLAHLKDCKNLRYLDLRKTQVSDAGLAHLKDCKNLKDLWLSVTNVSDAGLVHFKDCKDLAQLQVAGTQVSDAGLAHFKDCKNLEYLFLDNTQVGDAGLTHFTDCKNLVQVTLQQTQVTAAGVAKLSKALPRCKIE
jgi:serine/threonine protein kinase/uncharacterized membrane protein